VQRSLGFYSEISEKVKVSACLQPSKKLIQMLEADVMQHYLASTFGARFDLDGCANIFGSFFL
jgi:hypothetical protein